MFEPPALPPRLDPDPDRERAAPVAEPEKRDWKKGAGGAAVGFALIAGKFKVVLALLLHSKVLISGLSLLLSVWFYTLFFGLKFAIAFVLLIAVHELGHVFFIRASGLPGGMPYFIPGLGAFTTLGARPASAYQSSWIAFGGPLFGAMGSAICLSYGMIVQEPFWYAVAYTGSLMNFFNLLPVPPFDGGRIVEAVSPRLWLVGLALFAVGIVAFRLYTNFFIILLVLLSLPQMVKAWKGQIDPAYHDLTTRQRATVALAYFLLAGALFGGMLISHVSVPGRSQLG